MLGANRTNGAGRGDGGRASAFVLDGSSDLGFHSRLVGRRIHYLTTVDSTNSVLKSLAQNGEPPGSVVVADEQTEGRGRAGRSWFSPAGLGLWLSVLFRPRSDVGELAPLSMVVAVSVAEAVASASEVDVGVKWPNDIVADGRKLGGILLESLQGASGAVEYVVVGIGLNVDLERADLPDDLAETAVSLRMLTRRRIDRLALLRAILERLDEDWARFEREGPAPFLTRWRSLSTTFEREVEIASGASTVRGKAIGLSPAGALIVEESDGRRVEIWHGDVKEWEGADD